MSLDASNRLRTITKNDLLKVNRAKTILFLTVLLTLLFGTAVVVNMIRSFTRPVNELLQATRMIASGNLGYTISYKDKTEFGKLANNFNAMSGSLKEGYTKLQEETNERKKWSRNSSNPRNWSRSASWPAGLPMISIISSSRSSGISTSH
ncbi:MAG: HAMP domain-containing protein [Acidobacteriota bacterium]